MTEQLAAVGRRLESVRQLEAVVTAMRAIAASRARQSRKTLPGIRAFAAVIAGAIGRALPLLPAQDGDARISQHSRVLILFTAEQGFAGAFTDRILEAATPLAAGAAVFLVGSRGATIAEQRRLSPLWRTAMAPHIDGVSLVASRISEALSAHIATEGSDRVDLMFPVWSAGAMQVKTHCLLPFDYRRFTGALRGQPPLTTLPPRTLLGRLSEEYVFAEICEAAMLAFAAENEARAAAMVSAKSNIERVRAALEVLEHQVRQEEITAEVTELCRAEPR
ncbi:MAG: F0F1 ATP synthase subunit gamma [Acetobacteraceae bacterium]|nr:F0F1 ATP synthase subunit gamma [Acetobacteraceae bacterium]